jgi:hypothetical protein
MKNLLIILVSLLLLSFTDIPVNGFNIKTERGGLRITASLNEGEVSKEIIINREVTKENPDKVYLYRRVQCYNVNLWFYPGPGSYTVQTNVLMENGRVIKDFAKFKLE